MNIDLDALCDTCKPLTPYTRFRLDTLVNLLQGSGYDMHTECPRAVAAQLSAALTMPEGELNPYYVDRAIEMIRKFEIKREDLGTRLEALVQ